MSIATYLTLVRLVIAPIFLILYLDHADPWLLLVLVLGSELTDMLDGYVARLRHEVTNFGKLLDPMADSIARTTMLLAFSQPPINLHLLLICVFLYRDMIISTLRTICALRGVALAARLSGKIKAVLQACVIIAILIMLVLYEDGAIEMETMQNASTVIVAVAAAYAVLSAFDYVYANRRDIRLLFAN